MPDPDVIPHGDWTGGLGVPVSAAGIGQAETNSDRVGRDPVDPMIAVHNEGSHLWRSSKTDQFAHVVETIPLVRSSGHGIIRRTLPPSDDAFSEMRLERPAFIRQPERPIRELSSAARQSARYQPYRSNR